MTLEEDIKRLAELRRKKAEIDEEIKVSREAWMDENAGKILAASVAGDLVDEMEEKIRAAAVSVFQETGNKRPAPGVGIREVEKVDYDDILAIDWAVGHGHRGLLSLKKTDFERAAKSIRPDFVTISAVPQATIARKLEE